MVLCPLYLFKAVVFVMSKNTAEKPKKTNPCNNPNKYKLHLKH